MVLLSKSLIKYKWINAKGFSLLEVMIVLVVIAILAVVAVPAFIIYINRSRTVVCNFNTAQLERMYEADLMLNNRNHSEFTFFQYMNDYGERICPGNGDISYANGKVHCSIHSGDDDNDDDANEGDDGSVPYL